MAKREPVTTDMSDKQFNVNCGRNLASDGADIARLGRATGNLELEQMGNNMMNVGLDHAEAWQNR